MPSALDKQTVNHNFPVVDMADVIAGLDVASRHCWSVVVLDAEARALPYGGARLSNLRAAAIIQTHGRNAAIA